MNRYIATAGSENHTFDAATLDDARHWVINHLDTSKAWYVNQVGDEETLLLSNKRGVHLPKAFADHFAQYVTNADELVEEFCALREGPSCPDYWYAWEIVEAKAILSLAGQTYALDHAENGDLFGICKTHPCF